MKVRIDTWRGPQECELAHALTPTADINGISEQALSLAEANASAIGRIAAFLVESGQLSLNEACTLTGVYYSNIKEAKS